jgi:transposase
MGASYMMKKPKLVRSGKLTSKLEKLEMIRLDVAGIDIGSRAMQVCGPADSRGVRQVKTFETTTGGIRECVEWLKEQKVGSVAMESTGVYWIPVLEIMEEEGLEVVLVDTRPLSRVPGRKTDVGDSEWIQTLHSHGLLRGSFLPPEDISKLRSLVRQKGVLIAEQADWVRRMHKCLDQMNVRVHQAVTDTQGKTGMAMIQAIVEGERDPAKLAKLREGRCNKSEEQMAKLLTGNWREDHLFNLEQAFRLYQAIGERLAAYEKQIRDQMSRLKPVGGEETTVPPLANPQRAKAMKRRGQEEKRQELYRMVGKDLTAIDGIGTETAEKIISEYGTELSKFPNEKAFVAHLQLAPRQSVSGGKPVRTGKRKTTGTTAGRALRTAAISCSKTNTAIGAYYRRIARSKDARTAAFATARKLGTLVFRLLRWGQDYHDIGAEAYEKQFADRKVRNLQHVAAQFGYKLTPDTAS